MDFLTSLLAKLFSAFKTKNPTLAAVLIGLLVASLAFLEASGTQLFGEGALLWAKWINVILLGLVGTHTTEILAQEKKQDSAKK